MTTMQEKTVLVTGGAGGIGTAICQRVAESGASVILTYHNSKQSAETLLASLPGTGHLALQTRVDETPMVQELAERVQSQHGKLVLHWASQCSLNSYQLLLGSPDPFLLVSFGEGL